MKSSNDYTSHSNLDEIVSHLSDLFSNEFQRAKEKLQILNGQNALAITREMCGRSENDFERFIGTNFHD